jgi:hypothetical protein
MAVVEENVQACSNAGSHFTPVHECDLRRADGPATLTILLSSRLPSAQSYKLPQL